MVKAPLLVQQKALVDIDPRDDRNSEEAHDFAGTVDSVGLSEESTRAKRGDGAVPVPQIALYPAPSIDGSCELFCLSDPKQEALLAQFGCDILR